MVTLLQCYKQDAACFRKLWTSWTSYKLLKQIQAISFCDPFGGPSNSRTWGQSQLVATVFVEELVGAQWNLYSQMIAPSIHDDT